MWKKEEVFSKFVQLRVLFEKENGKKVKALSSDNGVEFVLHAFKYFYVKEIF